MSDERLRDLERRWHETGDLEDEAAYRRERARTRPTSTDLLRESVARYDSSSVRRAAEELLERRLAELVREPEPASPPPRWQNELLAEVVRHVTPLLGTLNATSFTVGDWCACHSWVGYGTRPRDVSAVAAAASYVSYLDRKHAFHVKLFELYDVLRFSRRDAAALASELRDAVRRLVALVVDELTCHDAWYGQPHEALALLLEEKDLPVSTSVLDAIEETFSGSFKSWTAPDAATVEVVADAVALALVRARFEAKYGSG